MFHRIALGIGLAALALAPLAPGVSWAQKSQTTPPPATSETPAAPATPAPATPPSEAFGEEATLTAKPIVYVKGNGTWDNAFETITGAFKKLKAYIDKEGLKSDGAPLTIFTSTDDAGFQFEAAIPITEPPKNPPHGGDIAIGTSPEGRALKFVHRGSYDSLDNTYEAITNYLDEKRLEAKDMFIEQYVTDPLSTNEDDLVINVFVLIK
jgi:effector-binding domain-containing protein